MANPTNVEVAVTNVDSSEIVPSSPSMTESWTPMNTPSSSRFSLVSEVDEQNLDSPINITSPTIGTATAAVTVEITPESAVATPRNYDIPSAVHKYINKRDDLTNGHIELMCGEEFAYDGKDYVVDDGNRAGLEAAMAYSFLAAVKSLESTPRNTGSKHSPLFVIVMLNNAGVKAQKKLFQDLWLCISGAGSAPLPVAFLKANMTRVMTETTLSKKPAIVVATPGKLVDLLSSKLTFDFTIKIVFNPLNALLIYNYRDEPIQEIIKLLGSHNHIVAMTTTLSGQLHMRFESLTPPAFKLNLKDMIHLKDERVTRLKWLLKHCDFVPTNDKDVPEYPKDKILHAVKCMFDAETREKEFGARPIVAITSYKITLRKMRSDAKQLFDEELAIFHGGGDDERWENLRDFTEYEDKLACTRRSLYGRRFDFVPAFLVVEFPKTLDEWRHIANWYLSMCAEHDLGPPFSDELSEVPKMKFLYEVDDDDDYHHVNYVLKALASEGVAQITMPHKLHAAHRRRDSFDFWF